MAKLAASEAATAVTHQVSVPVPRGTLGSSGRKWAGYPSPAGPLVWLTLPLTRLFPSGCPAFRGRPSRSWAAWAT